MPISAENDEDWTRSLARYRDPDVSRSMFELAVTVVPFIGLWTLAWAALSIGYWLTLLIAVPTAGFLVRLFIIQHDCGHGAFFHGRAANDRVGRIIGVVTLAPYGYWRRTHATHHAAVGNLEHRGIGDVATLTVNEYLASSSIHRFGYRFYRHPLFMFGLVPALLFLFHYRVPVGLMNAGIQPWLSALGTNLAIAVAIGAMAFMVGIGPFLMVHAPVMLIAASVGVWFFYVQHQFEDTRWDHEVDWNFQEIGLNGSSHYELPFVLAWFTGNVGVHHVHHLCSRIPFYRLPQVLKDYPQLAQVGRMTFFESLRCATLTLWDEEQKRLISFREVRTRYLSRAGQQKQRLVAGQTPINAKALATARGRRSSIGRVLRNA